MTLQECYEEAGGFPFLAKAKSWRNASSLILGTDSKGNFIEGIDNGIDYGTWHRTSTVNWTLLDYFDTELSAPSSRPTASTRSPSVAPRSSHEPPCACVRPDWDYSHDTGCAWVAWNHQRRGVL